MFSRIRTIIALFFIQLLWLCTATLACNVPVFRYALERWEADLYYAVVVHGPDGMDAAGQSAYDLLKECSVADYGVINLDVYQYTHSAVRDSQFAPLFKDAVPESGEPVIYLFHPASAKESGAIWTAPLSLKNVHRLLADTNRLQLLQKITSGVSVVMLMLDSGDPGLDQQAWQNLTAAVDTARQYIVMPEGIELYDGTIVGDGYASGDPDNKLWSSIPLKLEIDLQRISRTDENEVLVNSLLSVDPSVQNSAGSPMVFPVFGRGRFLYPMIGDEISEENVMYVSHYACGACSCEIKAQNPGMDLPILMDWEGIFVDKEQAIKMEQFIDAEIPQSANDADNASKKAFTITDQAMTVILIGGGTFALVGIVLFLRNRLL